MSRERLWDTLPAYHREEGGDLLQRYVGVADDLLERFGASERGEDAEIDATRQDAVQRLVEAYGFAPFRPEATAAADGVERALRAMAGTALALIEWFREADLPRPRVWPGIRARVEGPGLLRFLGTPGRSAVLAWERSAALRSPPEKAPPGWLLPPGTPLQAVVLRRIPRWGRPLAGSRVAGKKLWEIELNSRRNENEEKK